MKNPPKKERSTRAKCHPERPHAAHGLCQPCYVIQHRAKNIDAYRKASSKHGRKRRYGITEDSFNAILELQGSKCAICTEPLCLDYTNSAMRACVDHDHITKEIRGILCARCNSALGHLQDRPGYCVAAANYLLGRDLVIMRDHE